MLYPAELPGRGATTSKMGQVCQVFPKLVGSRRPKDNTQARHAFAPDQPDLDRNLFAGDDGGEAALDQANILDRLARFLQHRHEGQFDSAQGGPKQSPDRRP